MGTEGARPSAAPSLSTLPFVHIHADLSFTLTPGPGTGQHLLQMAKPSGSQT
jgi:hypothetical protein